MVYRLQTSRSRIIRGDSPLFFVAVDELPQLLHFFPAQPLALGEGGDKGGHGAFKGFLHHLLQPGLLGLLLGDQGGDNGIFVFQNTPLGKPADDGVGGGLAPAQLFLGKLHQLAGGNRLVLPQNQAEAVFTFKDFRCFHV